MRVHAPAARNDCSTTLNQWSRVLALCLCALGLVLLGSCNSGPSSPSNPTTTTTAAATTTTTAAATTTTTAAATTTTTTAATTTTTTTTTTTSGLINYGAQVHPIWGNEGCTNSGCHTSPGPPPDLSGGPTDSCSGLATRDAANDDLIITGGGAAGAQILTKPQPGIVGHAGGDYPCFGGSGSGCYDTILLWLQQGANGPSGTCGG